MPRVLIVDDNGSNLRLTCAVLEGEGWEVHAAVSAEAGLEAAKRLGPDGVDVVLLDVQMPGKTGLEALPEFQALLPTVPMVALTAYTMFGDRERFLSAGFTGYIPKPIEVPLFGSQVERFIHKAPDSGAHDP